MRRGVYFVDGICTHGGYGPIDVLDLEETSFRAWLIEAVRGNRLENITPSNTWGETIEYQQKQPDRIHENAPRGFATPTAPHLGLGENIPCKEATNDVQP